MLRSGYFSPFVLAFSLFVATVPVLSWADDNEEANFDAKQMSHYFGFGLDSLAYKETPEMRDGLDKSLRQAHVLFGFNVWKSVFVELRYGGDFGSGAEIETDVSAQEVDVEVSNIGQLWLRWYPPRISDSASIYTLVGATWAKVKTTRGGVSILSSQTSQSADELDASLGLGFEFRIGQAMALQVEYSRLIKKESFYLNNLGFGVVFQF